MFYFNSENECLKPNPESDDEYLQAQENKLTQPVTEGGSVQV